jgi:hypothetical protein
MNNVWDRPLESRSFNKVDLTTAATIFSNLDRFRHLQVLELFPADGTIMPLD